MSKESNNSVNETTNEVDSLYLEQYAFTTAAALVGSLNKRVFVLLRDGTNLFGILRTFDQYANLVIQDTLERIYLADKKQYGENYQDSYLIRGENVVMFGEMDLDTEDDHLRDFERIDFMEAKKQHKAEVTKLITANKESQKIFAEKGFTAEISRGDLY